MTHANNTPMTLAELERLLDVYGSERTRWPAEARAGAGQLVARDRAARRLLAEAEALDRVLERAPLPSLAKEAALAERILAAARRSPRIVSIGEPAAVPAAPAETRPITPWRWLGVRVRTLAGSEAGRAASLMAAALAFGVVIGLSNLPQGVLPAIEEMTGISLGSSASYAVAHVDSLDEDLL